MPTFRTSIARSGARLRARSTARWTRRSSLPTISSPTSGSAVDLAAGPHFRNLIQGSLRMSEGEFHVHGPHEHEVEHQAEHGDPFAGRIAVMTAIFATIGASFGYMGGATQNDALLFKNEAAIRKTEASDQWNFYQAKSSKQNLAELGATLTSGELQARYQKEVDRYKKEKEEIMGVAKGLEDKGKEAEHKSEASMHVHHRWAQAMTLIQISIALAAITILTRNTALQYIAYGAAAVSIAIGG